jgi:TonB family protein
MDREAIRRVIVEHLAEIRACYEHELQRSPGLYGKLTVTWDIEESGRVARASVKSNSLESPAVGECLVAHLKSWRFPDPPANQIGRISYPFIFSSN